MLKCNISLSNITFCCSVCGQVISAHVFTVCFLLVLINLFGKPKTVTQHQLFFLLENPSVPLSGKHGFTEDNDTLLFWQWKIQQWG